LKVGDGNSIDVINHLYLWEIDEKSMKKGNWINPPRKVIIEGEREYNKLARYMMNE
jgi:hypothetical protein